MLLVWLSCVSVSRLDLAGDDDDHGVSNVSDVSTWALKCPPPESTCWLMCLQWQAGPVLNCLDTSLIRLPVNMLDDMLILLIITGLVALRPPSTSNGPPFSARLNIIEGSLESLSQLQSEYDPLADTLSTTSLTCSDVSDKSFDWQSRTETPWDHSQSSCCSRDCVTM